jgi:5-methylcytosine-specific restriction endonuclease McrA
MPRAPRRCPGDHGNCAELIRGRKYCETHTVAWAGGRTASSEVTKTYEWQQFREQILQRDGYLCRLAYPGICTGYATVVDKRQPAARRPDLALDPANAQAACPACNDHKARTIDRRSPTAH